MVASITPGTTSGTTGAGALGVETRLARPQLTLPQRPQAQQADDAARVSVSEAAANWRASQASVSDGLAALDLALAAGREALVRLNEIGEAARNGGDVQGALDAYAETLDQAESALLLGRGLEIDAEPGANPLTIAGADIQLSALGLPANADDASAAAIARNAQDGAALLQQHLTRFDAAARALEAHAGFLSAVGGEARDVDADSARLLALQVRQDLGAAGLAIANAQPQAVLALFRE